MLNETSSKVLSDLIREYGAWIEDHLQKGWDGYQLGLSVQSCSWTHGS